MTTALHFAEAVTRTTHLVFGRAAAAPVADPYDDIGASVRVGLRGLASRASACSDRSDTAAPAAWTASTAWEGAACADESRRDRYDQALRLGTAGRAPWDDTRPVGNQLRSAWDQTGPISMSSVDRQQQAWQVGASQRSAWHIAVPAGIGHLAEFRSARAGSRVCAIPWQAVRTADRAIDLIWQDDMQPPPGCWRPGVIPPVGIPHPIHLRLACPLDRTTHLVFGRLCAGATGGIVIPVRSYYIVINHAALRRVSNNLTLPATSISISIDAQSVQWSWSASLPLAALPDLERDAPGVPVELEASINGTIWRVACERIEEEERFGASSLRIGGRGIAAEISDPLYPIVQHENVASAMTMLQLAGRALTANGVPLGWSLDWQASDWLVPAGCWVFSGTPLQAVARLAEAAGAYVQPARDGRVLRVLPRFPVKPWEWASAPAGVVLPAAATLHRGTTHQDKPDYNLVIISGQAGGITGRVKREGTAGDRPAQMIVDPLITHVDAAAARGLAILGDTGPQVIARLETGVLPSSGVISVGTLLDFQRDGVSHKGLVRGLSVSASASGRAPVVVRQMLEVEFHG